MIIYNECNKENVSGKKYKNSINCKSQGFSAPCLSEIEEKKIK